MIAEVLIPILALLANLVTYVVIIQFVLSMLVAFNVVNYHNQFVAALMTGLNAILDPILAPIRRHMPRTGGLDFSPIVLLFLIQVAMIILTYIGNHYG